MLEPIRAHLAEKFRYWNVSERLMVRENFSQKFRHTWEIISGESDEIKSDLFTIPSSYGLLDILFLGIPRSLKYVAEQMDDPWISFTQIEVAPDKFNFNPTKEQAQALEIGPFRFIREGLQDLLSVPFAIQRTLGFVLTAVLSIALVLPLVDWLYPYDPSAKVTAEDSVIHWLEPDSEKEPIEPDTGRNRRRFFFNPSTWIFLGFLTSVFISGLVQFFDAALFAQVAVYLVVLQTIFVGIAATMFIGAVLSLAYWGIELLIQGKEAGPGPESAVNHYHSDFKNWCANHKILAGSVITLGVASVLTLLVLTLGFFTGGFGLFPDAFSFMGPLLDFLAKGFTTGIQHASSLPGLEFLAAISQAGAQLIGQIAAVSTLFLAAVFVPDNLRRILQHLTEEKAPDGDQKKPDVADNKERIVSVNLSKQESKTLFTPKPTAHCPATCSRDPENGEIKLFS